MMKRALCFDMIVLKWDSLRPEAFRSPHPLSVDALCSLIEEDTVSLEDIYCALGFYTQEEVILCLCKNEICREAALGYFNGLNLPTPEEIDMCLVCEILDGKRSDRKVYLKSSSLYDIFPVLNNLEENFNMRIYRLGGVYYVEIPLELLPHNASDFMVEVEMKDVDNVLLEHGELFCDSISKDEFVTLYC